MRAATEREEHQALARDGVASRSGVKMSQAAKRFTRAVNEDVARVAADCPADVVLCTQLASAG